MKEKFKGAMFICCMLALGWIAWAVPAVHLFPDCYVTNLGARPINDFQVKFEDGTNASTKQINSQSTQWLATMTSRITQVSFFDEQRNKHELRAFVSEYYANLRDVTIQVDSAYAVTFWQRSKWLPALLRSQGREPHQMELEKN